MRMLILSLVIATDAIAQLSPRVEVVVEYSATGKDAVSAKTITDEIVRQTAKIAEDKPVSDVKLDDAPTVKTNISGGVFVRSVTFYEGKETQDSAKRFIIESTFPKGAVVRMTSHLCPGTNEPPANWLGCKLDPRAEHSETVLKP